MASQPRSAPGSSASVRMRRCVLAESSYRNAQCGIPDSVMVLPISTAIHGAERYRMADDGTAGVLHARDCATTHNFDDFALVCCGQPHLNLLTDPESSSLTQHLGRVGPVTVNDIVVGEDFTTSHSDACNSSRIVPLQAGRTQSLRSGRSIDAGAGAGVIYAPEGFKEVRWAAGTKLTSLKVERGALDDAVADAWVAQGRSVDQRRFGGLSLGLYQPGPIRCCPCRSLP
jgi:hypothetical protein